MNTTKASTKIAVEIRIDSDDDASRVGAVLEALGYEVVRQLDPGDGPGRLSWAIDRLTRRHGLTPREREVLAGVLDGHSNRALARALDISRATVKWHLHNVFAKTRAANREALLRVALQLGEPARERDEHWAGPHEITRRIERPSDSA